MTISIIWTYPKKPNVFSKLTKWFLGRNYDHVAMIFYNSNNLPIVFETSAKHGTRTIDLDSFVEEKMILKAHKVKLLSSDQRLYGFIDGMLGKPYSYILQPLTALMYRLGLPFRFFNGNAKSWCSETIAQVLSYYCAIQFDKKFDMVLPTDIDDRLKTSTEK